MSSSPESSSGSQASSLSSFEDEGLASSGNGNRHRSLESSSRTQPFSLSEDECSASEGSASGNGIGQEPQGSEDEGSASGNGIGQEQQGKRLRFTEQNRGKLFTNSERFDLEPHEEEAHKGKLSKTNRRAGRKVRDSESSSSSSSSASSSSATEDAVAGQESQGKGSWYSPQNGGKVLTNSGAVDLNSPEESSKMSEDDEEASTRDLDSSHHSTLPSDLDPPSPHPHMRQAPPLSEGRSSVGDEDNTSAQRFTVSLSTLSLLLLQSAHSSLKAGALPDILSPPVNSRHGIDCAKLVSTNAKHNILLRHIQNRSKDGSPIGSSIHGVLFSFTHDPSGECSSSPLKSLCTVDGNHSGGRFDVRGMTTGDCERTLKWLDPTSTFAANGGDLVQGKRLILEKLGKLPMHGSFDQMKRFFEEKTWDKPGTEELAGKAQQTIQKELQRSDEDSSRIARITLRTILLKMIPYQLQMACAVVDGMHRMITVLCASVGACPGRLNPELRTRVQMFTSGLRSTEEDGSGMGILNTEDSGAIVDINTQLFLVDWGQETLDSTFFKRMTEKSRALQDNDSSGDEHTARSVIHQIMCLFLKELPQLETGCLFRSADDDCSMAKALAATQVAGRPNHDQRYNQVKEFLEGTAIPEDIREAYLRRIKDDEEELKKCYTNYFGQICTQLWVEGVARHIRKVLSKFCKDNKTLLEGWHDSQLSELVLWTTDEQWLGIFKRRKGKTLGAGDASLNCCGCKDMTYLSTLSDKNQDPLEPRYGRLQAETQGSTIMRFHEFLWIIMWAHLSVETLEKFRDLFSGASMNHPHYPQEKACLTSHVERTVTCIVQVVTCAVHSSTAIWRSAMDSTGKGCVKPYWKHANPALEPQLFLVAVEDALTFVKHLGFNPVYHEHLRWKNNPAMRLLDTTVGGPSRITDVMGTDLMVCQVIAFVAQMKHLTDTCEELVHRSTSLKKSAVKSPRTLIRKEILKHALQEKFSSGDPAGEDLAALMARVMDPLEKGFDLRPVLGLIEFTKPLSLKEGGHVHPCTHSISKFMLVGYGDWNKSEQVETGPFFDIGHVTRLFSEANQTKSARSGGDEKDNGADAGARADAADDADADEDDPASDSGAGAGTGAGAGAGADADADADTDADEDADADADADADEDADAAEKKRKRELADAEEKKRKRELDAKQRRKIKRRKTKERATAQEACLAEARSVLQPIASLADETADETADDDAKFNRFQEELAKLKRDQVINLYNVLKRLRNGDGDGESEEQVSGPGSPRCSYVEDQAKCGDGSADEEVDEQDYCDADDNAFIDSNEDPSDNTAALHRQYDNNARDRDHSWGDVSFSHFSIAGDVSWGSLDAGMACDTASLLGEEVEGGREFSF